MEGDTNTPASPCWTNDQRNGQASKTREVYYTKKQQQKPSKKKKKNREKKAAGENKEQARSCGCYCCPSRQRQSDPAGKPVRGEEKVEENNNHQQNGGLLTNDQGRPEAKKDHNDLVVKESLIGETEKKKGAKKKTNKKDKEANNNTKQKKKSTKNSKDAKGKTKPSKESEPVDKGEADLVVLQQSFPVSRSKEQEWEQQIHRQEMHHLMGWTRTQGQSQTQGGEGMSGETGEVSEATLVKEEYHRPATQEVSTRRVSEYDVALQIITPQPESSDVAAPEDVESDLDTLEAASANITEATHLMSSVDNKECVAEDTVVKASAHEDHEEGGKAIEENSETISEKTDGAAQKNKKKKNAQLQVTLPMNGVEVDKSPASSKSPQTATSFARAGFGVLQNSTTVHNRTVSISLKNRAKCVLVEAEFLLGDGTDLVSKLGRVIECKSQSLLKLTQLGVWDDIECVSVFEVQGVRTNSRDPWFLFTQFTWKCKSFDPEYKIGFMNASHHNPEASPGDDLDLFRKLRIGAVRRIKPRVVLKRGMAHTEVIVELRDD